MLNTDIHAAASFLSGLSFLVFAVFLTPVFGLLPFLGLRGGRDSLLANRGDSLQGDLRQSLNDRLGLRGSLRKGRQLDRRDLHGSLAGDSTGLISELNHIITHLQ